MKTAFSFSDTIFSDVRQNIQCLIDFLQPTFWKDLENTLEEQGVKDILIDNASSYKVTLENNKKATLSVSQSDLEKLSYQYSIENTVLGIYGLSATMFCDLLNEKKISAPQTVFEYLKQLITDHQKKVNVTTIHSTFDATKKSLKEKNLPEEIVNQLNTDLNKLETLLVRIMQLSPLMTQADQNILFQNLITQVSVTQDISEQIRLFTQIVKQSLYKKKAQLIIENVNNNNFCKAIIFYDRLVALVKENEPYLNESDIASFVKTTYHQENDVNTTPLQKDIQNTFYKGMNGGPCGFLTLLGEPVTTIHKITTHLRPILKQISNLAQEIEQKINFASLDDNLKQALSDSISHCLKKILDTLDPEISAQIAQKKQIYFTLIEKQSLAILKTGKKEFVDIIHRHQTQIQNKMSGLDRLKDDILALLDKITALFTTSSSSKQLDTATPPLHKTRTGFFFNDYKTFSKQIETMFESQTKRLIPTQQ